MLDRRLLFVSGKGGVGKSAVTVSLARHAARTGRNVLAVALINDIGLASHLDTEALSYEAREAEPNLWALGVDRASALDEYVRLQLHLPKAAPIAQFTKLFQVLVDIAPGVREIVSIGKPLFEARQDDYDVVLVDSPPIGQLQSYLGAPATISELVPSGRVRDQAVAMRDFLADHAKTGLMVVTTPEELPVIEALQVTDELRVSGVVDVVGLAANRVLPDLAVSPSELGALPAGPAKAAAALHQELFADQSRWLERLPAGPRLPHVFGSASASQVADVLTDRWDLE